MSRRFANAITVNVACPACGEEMCWDVEMDGGCVSTTAPMPETCTHTDAGTGALTEAEQSTAEMAIRAAAESHVQGARDYARYGE